MYYKVIANLVFAIKEDFNIIIIHMIFDDFVIRLDDNICILSLLDCIRVVNPIQRFTLYHYNITFYGLLNFAHLPIPLLFLSLFLFLSLAFSLSLSFSLAIPLSLSLLLQMKHCKYIFIRTTMYIIIVYTNPDQAL